LPAFFIEYYTTPEGAIDSGIRGKQKVACVFTSWTPVN